MTASSWLIFLVITSLQVGSPGPSTVYLIGNSLKYGKSRAIFILTGDIFAILILGLISSLGIVAFFSENPTMFKMLKIAGATYLVYLGAKSLIKCFSQKNVSNKSNGKNIHCDKTSKLWWQSFFVGLSNPKALIYFSSLLPQFEAEGNGDIYLYISLVVLTAVMKLIILSGYAVMASRLSNKTSSSRVQKITSGLIGVFFIIFGVMLGVL
ncbi:LysE family translocator [Vibrio sp. CAIM 722]|uniref:LysE family translocator n=1 Tax=Vibrio eleionomae TaxID=2653505 RepID=A0A7X4RVW7_9VIBR|nr:LysE family translocator [Vibrio eleionomae]MZI94988.1 LysE family translocator [Vibrio eleionomae]